MAQSGALELKHVDNFSKAALGAGAGTRGRERETERDGPTQERETER